MPAANNRLQRTVRRKVPRHMRQRAAAEPERWAPTGETNIAMKGSLRNCWLGYTGYT